MPRPRGPDANAGEVVGAALPLEYEDDLDPLMDRIGTARCVLIGEASHGTHEYYAWRAALTRRLVAERGFSIVAVEGDWPDCRRVGRSVTLAPGSVDDPRDALDAYERWPTWMWANEETARFCRWLRDRNAGLPPGERTGFYGLDVYSLWESLRAVIDYLAEHHPEYLATALEAYRCFEPHGADPRAYGWNTALVPGGCEEEILALLTRLRRPVGRGGAGDPTAELDARQNAEVVANAERYYRTMIGGGPDSWNVRETHMADTLDRLMAFHAASDGPGKAVVWAHNTHVGDARATDMAAAGMVSLGRLARERHGRDQVVLVGFAGGPGETVAAPRWGAPMEIMHVPPPVHGSLEEVLAESELHRGLFVVPPEEDKPAFLTRTLGHRAIGVVYDPDADRRHYVPTRLADRYDALCWFRATSALQPLHLEAARRGELETMPTGV
ncbi:erythromycin esterase-like protein [Actinomadura pelletieri DSM 43383]|uniref:Erythromycin esterase-like protein n=1 Tax=Actinomadura pelletieri DSM 43383 TaxID=1120940 RepID=A0A495QKL8_9ACTN|nr:erythromycin esterase family protein [Actinomadura pelletieri]RKS73033.1 erythromycin esterase-like protein [Actinomadura pelletieri DSM 43383]